MIKELTKTQIRIIKMAEELKKSSEALEETVNILNASGQEGTAISTSIQGTLADVSNLENQLKRQEELLAEYIKASNTFSIIGIQSGAKAREFARWSSLPQEESLLQDNSFPKRTIR